MPPPPQPPILLDPAQQKDPQFCCSYDADKLPRAHNSTPDPRLPSTPEGPGSMNQLKRVAQTSV